MKQTKTEMIRAYDELLKKLEAKAESGLPEKKMEHSRNPLHLISSKVENIPQDLYGKLPLPPFIELRRKPKHPVNPVDPV